MVIRKMIFFGVVQGELKQNNPVKKGFTGLCIT